MANVFSEITHGLLGSVLVNLVYYLYVGWSLNSGSYFHKAKQLG